MSDWKTRLYDAYVTSGQAGATQRNIAATLAARAPSIKAMIAKHVPADRNIRVLDLACGYGAMLYFLKQAGYQNCQGVDISAEQADLAQTLGLTNVVCKPLGLALKDTPDASVDLILVIDVLEHLTRQEIFDTLDEVYRVLRPSGRCIAHVPNAEGLFGMRIRYGDLTHEGAFAPTSARQCFQTIGFSEINCFEDRPIVHGWKSAVRRTIWALGTLPARLLLIAETGQSRFVLSQNMLIVADKRESA